MCGGLNLSDCDRRVASKQVVDAPWNAECYSIRMSCVDAQFLYVYTLLA